MSDVVTGIKCIIAQKGLKYKDVAARAGFTAQQFSDMLCGRKVIRAEHLPLIAKALEVSVSEIFENQLSRSG